MLFAGIRSLDFQYVQLSSSKNVEVRYIDELSNTHIVSAIYSVTTLKEKRFRLMLFV